MKVNSHNEWDKLREVIVGTADGSIATLSWMRPDPIPPKVLEKATELSLKASPKWFYDDGSVYILNSKDIMKNNWVGKKKIKVFNEKKYTFEIDDRIDFEVLKMLSKLKIICHLQQRVCAKLVGFPGCENIMTL